MKRLLLAAALGLCFALLPQSAHAQSTASISGTVRNQATGEPLPLANVALQGTPRGVAADENGRYVLEELRPGRYTVVASYLGFERFRQRITLQAGEERRLDIRLTSSELEVGQVTVTGEREAIDTKDLGVERLSTADVRRLPAVLEPDVFRTLQLLPGVQAANDFSSGLYIRGGSPDQTLILLDRTPVYNPTHFFGFFSTFNPDAIQDVRLFKGGYPAEYGGRLGSVVDLYTRSGSPEKIEGTASVGFLASRATVRGPQPLGTWMVSLRRSTLEPLLAVLQERDITGIPNSFYFYDLNAKATFEASKRDRLTLSVYAGEDNLDFPFLDDANVDVSYGNRIASGTWTRLYSETLFWNLTLTASHYFSRPRFDIGGTRFDRTNELYDVSARGDVEWAPGGAHTFKSGFWLGRLGVTLGRAIDGREQFSPDVDSRYLMLYVQDTYRPLEQWELRGGLRGTYRASGSLTKGAYLNLEPRLSVEYQPTDKLRLQAGYGRYYQHLTLQTSEIFSGIDTWLSTGEGVPPSHGDQFVLGVKADLEDVDLVEARRLAEDLEVSVEVYYRTMRDLFRIDPFFSDIAGQDYRDAFVFGEGAARGVEVKLEGARERASGFLAYTLSQTRRRFPEINTSGGTTPQPLFFPPKYDRRHDLRLVANYDLATQWRASAIFTYATGQPYTRPQAQYKLIGDPFDDTPRDVFVAPFNDERLPAYHRLDLGVARTGRFFGFADYELQFQLINAYNRSNVWFYFFEFNENDVERNTVTQIPVPLPNISLTIDF